MELRPRLHQRAPQVARCCPCAARSAPRKHSHINYLCSSLCKTSCYCCNLPLNKLPKKLVQVLQWLSRFWPSAVVIMSKLKAYTPNSVSSTAAKPCMGSAECWARCTHLHMAQLHMPRAQAQQRALQAALVISAPAPCAACPGPPLAVMPAHPALTHAPLIRIALHALWLTRSVMLTRAENSGP